VKPENRSFKLQHLPNIRHFLWQKRIVIYSTNIQTKAKILQNALSYDIFLVSNLPYPMNTRAPTLAKLMIFNIT
jgi:hypothetical protein